MMVMVDDDGNDDNVSKSETTLLSGISVTIHIVVGCPAWNGRITLI